MHGFEYGTCSVVSHPSELSGSGFKEIQEPRQMKIIVSIKGDTVTVVTNYPLKKGMEK